MFFFSNWWKWLQLNLFNACHPPSYSTVQTTRTYTVERHLLLMSQTWVRLIRQVPQTQGFMPAGSTQPSCGFSSDISLYDHPCITQIYHWGYERSKVYILWVNCLDIICDVTTLQTAATAEKCLFYFDAVSKEEKCSLYKMIVDLFHI